MRKHRLLLGSLFGRLLAFAVVCLSAKAQTNVPNEWTWMGGSSTIGSTVNSKGSQSGAYGTLGVPSTANVPGGRWRAARWTDSEGNFWLFGGEGYDATGGYCDLNDLWEFNPSTNQWTWISGNSTLLNGDTGRPGVYGTQGTPAAGNNPGGRAGAAHWTDSSGNLWLFGGDGFDVNDNLGELNDLWEFSPSTSKWTWVGGSSTKPPVLLGQPGVYGTLGTPTPGNIPGGRELASSWTDNSGHLWLFGGYGWDSTGEGDDLNDLWEYDLSTNEWTWMGGSNIVNQYGVYGVLETPAAANIPTSRDSATSWTDREGNFWLFGGDGFGAGFFGAAFNDLWEFNPSTNEWAWMSGSNSPVCSANPSNGCAQPGVFGTLGTPSAGNVPASRGNAASWTDSSGNLWLFGGYNYWGGDAGLQGDHNDFWMFNPFTNEWTWMGGSSTSDLPGVYGVLARSAAGNMPGSRNSTTTWTDQGGNLWLFGGAGIDAGGIDGEQNDVWKYQLAITAIPAFSVAPSTYTTPQTVTISDTTPGATIYYTTNGTTPTISSTTYDGPITVSSTETLEAIATASGYSTSAVASATYTIPPDFSIVATPNSFTLTAGQSGTTTVAVTPLYGFNSTVSFSCSGLPTGASCSFFPQTVTLLSGAAASTTLTVTTPATSATLHRNYGPLFPGSALAVALCCIGRKRLRLKMLLLAVSTVGLSLFTGCSGSTPVLSTVTVVATSGSIQHSTALSLSN